MDENNSREPGNSQCLRLQGVLTDHVKIGPVAGIEVLKSAETLVVEVLVPSQPPGNSKSWARLSRGLQQYARQYIRPGPRAQVSGRHSPVRFEAAPNTKADMNCLQSTSLDMDPGKSFNQRGL